MSPDKTSPPLGAAAHGVSAAGRQVWRTENVAAFAAQSEWHERNGHPLAEIIAGPAGGIWREWAAST